MRGALSEIRKRGAELVVVGNGRPDQLAAFREDEALDFPAFVDPELLAYRAAGLRRNPLGALSLKMPGRALRALRSGARQGMVQGDPWQLGGAFAIRTDGRVAYRHVSRELGDHADIPAILAALEG